VKSSCSSLRPIEILESRIAPAGNVLAQVVGGHLLVTGDAAANAFEITEATGGTTRMVAYLLTPTDDTTTINGSAAPLRVTGVTGDVRIALGAGSDVLRVGGITEFATIRTIRDLKIEGGAGDNTIELRGGVYGRNLAITNGIGNDEIDATRGLVVEGNVSISNGRGDSATRLGGGFGTGNLSISNGAGGKFVAEINAATINGNLNIRAPKAGMARILIGADEIEEAETSQVFGNLQITTGPGRDEIAVANVGRMDAGRISTGSGDDFLILDDVDFSKEFALSTGAGADAVKIETRQGSGLSTLFDGHVRVNLGAGNDVLRLGVAGSIVTRVEVFLSNRWDGGTGEDRIDAANVFTFRTEPTFVRFDHYGAPPLFGDPSFSEIGSYDAGTYPTDLLSADLNGDGDPDLVAVDNELGTLNLLFGKGDGTFQREVVIPAGLRPTGLAVGDFDGRNGPDLVVATQGERLISLFLTDGTGSFGSRTTFNVGRDIPLIDLVAADFNSDLKLDVATLNISSFQDTSLSILLGGGDGTFTFLQEYALKPEPKRGLEEYFGAPTDIAIGDINRDGTPDLAVSGRRGFGILVGNGDGTFRVRLEERAVASGLELAYLNRDGKLDLLTQVNRLELQLGNGDGTFGQPMIISARAAGEPYVADLNNDAILDVVATRSDQYGDLLEVLIGKGDGTFVQSLDFEIGNEFGPLANRRLQPGRFSGCGGG
jgi:hypothetical protein